MRLHWFHLMPYPFLPDDFKQKYRSVWVDVPSALYDPEKGHRIYNQYLDQLEFADSLGYRRHLRQRAPSKRLRAHALPESHGRGADAAHVQGGPGGHGQQYRPVQSAGAGRGRICHARCHERRAPGGRFPVGTSMDTNFCYGVHTGHAAGQVRRSPPAHSSRPGRARSPFILMGSIRNSGTLTSGRGRCKSRTRLSGFLAGGVSKRGTVASPT